MARPGPDPRGEGGEGWRYVIDRPYRKKSPVALPATRPTKDGDVPIHPLTQAWWKTASTMPHCELWTLGDWHLLLSTALLYDQAVTEGNTSAYVELRRREDELGFTSEARRKLRIKWASAEEYAQLTGKDAKTTAPKTTLALPTNVSRMDDRRRRALAEG